MPKDWDEWLHACRSRRLRWKNEEGALGSHIRDGSKWRLQKTTTPSLYTFVDGSRDVSTNRPIWAQFYASKGDATIELLGYVDTGRTSNARGCFVVEGRPWNGGAIALLGDYPTSSALEAFRKFADDSTDLGELDQRGRTWRQVLDRRGQIGFRSALLNAFGGTCCVSGCPVEAVLEAAHLVPHADGGPSVAVNGLLLRADLHVLFDVGLLAITPNTLRVVLHPSVRCAPDYQGLPESAREPQGVKVDEWRLNLARHFAWARLGEDMRSG